MPRVKTGYTLFIRFGILFKFRRQRFTIDNLDQQSIHPIRCVQKVVDKVNNALPIHVIFNIHVYIPVVIVCYM